MNTAGIPCLHLYKCVSRILQADFKVFVLFVASTFTKLYYPILRVFINVSKLTKSFLSRKCMVK